jgi:hypothetical protein
MRRTFCSRRASVCALPAATDWQCRCPQPRRPPGTPRRLSESFRSLRCPNHQEAHARTPVFKSLTTPSCGRACVRAKVTGVGQVEDRLGIVDHHQQRHRHESHRRFRSCQESHHTNLCLHQPSCSNANLALPPMAAPALADHHRNPQDVPVPGQGSSGAGAGPCCESCSWSGQTIAAGGPLIRASSSSVWLRDPSPQRADSYPERASHRPNTQQSLCLHQYIFT